MPVSKCKRTDGIQKLPFGNHQNNIGFGLKQASEIMGKKRYLHNSQRIHKYMFISV